MTNKKFIINSNFPVIYKDSELCEYVVNIASKMGNMSIHIYKTKHL